MIFLRIVLLLFFCVACSHTSKTKEVNIISKIMKHPPVIKTIENTTNNLNTDQTTRFQGILLADEQLKCMGDITRYDLIFSKFIMKDRKPNFQICRQSVTFGRCGTPSNKVENIDSDLICKTEP